MCDLALLTEGQIGILPLKYKSTPQEGRKHPNTQPKKFTDPCIIYFINLILQNVLPLLHFIAYTYIYVCIYMKAQATNICSSHFIFMVLKALKEEIIFYTCLRVKGDAGAYPNYFRVNEGNSSAIKGHTRTAVGHLGSRSTKKNHVFELV